jgi:GIY-YIG catalytic domain
MSCRSANIVYLITCRKCRIQYVGETSRTLAERLTDHRSNIKHRKNTPIAIHFNSANHSAADLRAVAIEQIRDSERTLTVRRQREQYWQNKLGTKHPQGLNELPVE